MQLPMLNELPTTREMINVFGGYNHNLRINEGEFYDMKNLTSADYPILSPRNKRGIYVASGKPNGMVAKDSLCYVDGRKFVVNKNENFCPALELDEYKDESGNIIPKTLISMGAYVIIMPDKKYINTVPKEDGTIEHGNIEASVTTNSTVTFQICKRDGTGYGDTPAQPTAPSDPENMDMWIDTSGDVHALKMYSETEKMWVSIASTYIRISATGIGVPFSEGDGVTISGVESEDLKAINDVSMVIQAKDDDYIVVTGIIKEVITQTTPLKIERKMPEMDFIVESENRLWGCRYGPQGDKIVNEIYASKLGDFKNWNCFAGVSTDSYAATVGTDGQFTGAITHLGRPIFFKENCMHKVYGNFPANFQIQTTACRGVQKGSHKSLSIVNEVLYYKSQSAICAYDGSLPTEISSAFGDEVYYNAVAGSLGNKYYVSMSDANEEWHLFVFDTKKGMWHREDETQVTEFCNCRGDLYFIDRADNQIKTVRGTGVLEDKEIRWEAVTGIIGTDSPDKKYISRIDVRMSLKVGARVSFFAEYDSSGAWEHLFTMDGISLRSFAIPIRPQRCDHMRLRIVGDGEAKVYSICKTIEQGSDV